MVGTTVHKDKFIFQRSIVIASGFVFLLWLIRVLEDSMMINLGVWGILPRSLSGLVGILTAPLIHGSAYHLLSNTFPLIMLLVAVFYFYDKIATEVFIWIYMTTGFWVWVMAREAYHIGASGLVYGLAAFLFFSGIFRKDARSVAVALVIAFIHGGMLQGLVPTKSNISWESHLLGFAAGIFCSFYFRKVPTADKNGEKKSMQEEAFGGINNTFYGGEFSEPEMPYILKRARHGSEKKKLSYRIDVTKGDDEDLLL